MKHIKKITLFILLISSLLSSGCIHPPVGHPPDTPSNIEISET